MRTDMSLSLYIQLANGLLATTYGWGEMYCGDVGRPVACAEGAVTASGEILRPLTQATVAVAAPSWVAVPPGGVWVRLRLPGHPCSLVKVTDKMNERWIGVRGWDLTPAAIVKLGGSPHPRWASKVFLCRADKNSRHPIDSRTVAFDSPLPIERFLPCAPVIPSRPRVISSSASRSSHLSSCA